jgi:hypothetical protein
MEETMNRLKRIMQQHTILMLVLFAGFVLPVFAQSQQLDSVTASAKGHGKISTGVDELEITSALIFLRENGTFLVAVTTDVQLQAEGTWKASSPSYAEIELKITGGVLKGELTGSGKLVLTRDRTSIKQLAMNLKTSDGRPITITFVAKDSETPE